MKPSNYKLSLLTFLLIVSFSQQAPCTGWFVDPTHRNISLEDVLQENYAKQELENDKPFNYLPSPRIILCSQPSSGNSFCRYALEYLTKRPSTEFFFSYNYETTPYFSRPANEQLWFHAINPPWGVQYPDMGIDFSKAPILKFHNIKIVFQGKGVKPLLRPSKDKLILIVRDYKELYFRIASTNQAPIEEHLDCYFELLRLYDLYPTERKLLIYYEDMMKDPARIFASLLEFTEDNPAYLDEFMEHIHYHKQRCAELYNIPGHARSLNKENFSYTTEIPEKDLLRLEKEVKKKYRLLFERYLKRYQIKK